MRKFPAKCVTILRKILCQMNGYIVCKLVQLFSVVYILFCMVISTRAYMKFAYICIRVTKYRLFFISFVLDAFSRFGHSACMRSAFACIGFCLTLRACVSACVHRLSPHLFFCFFSFLVDEGAVRLVTSAGFSSLFRCHGGDGSSQRLASSATSCAAGALVVVDV